MCVGAVVGFVVLQGQSAASSATRVPGFPGIQSLSNSYQAATRSLQSSFLANNMPLI